MKRNIELVKAARLGDLEKVKNILETTEKFEHNELNIALEYALLKGHRDIVKELIIAGASNIETELILNDDINDGNFSFCKREAENYVQCIYELMLIYYSYIGDLEMSEILIYSGSDVNAKSYLGNTALISASGFGHLEIVKCLIDRGADVNAKNNNNWTALMYASKNGHLEIVKYLIDRGADINIKNGKAITALHAASAFGDLEIVKLLIDLGADINVKDKKEITALGYALKNGHSEVAEFLKANGAK